jgi:hypothetical protein
MEARELVEFNLAKMDGSKVGVVPKIDSDRILSLDNFTVISFFNNCKSRYDPHHLNKNGREMWTCQVSCVTSS